MTQKDIAVALDIHESTVSRALKDKIILVGSHVYPSNYFFRDAVDGDLSQDLIIKMIKDVISQEPKEKPYSDSRIM